LKLFLHESAASTEKFPTLQRFHYGDLATYRCYLPIALRWAELSAFSCDAVTAFFWEVVSCASLLVGRTDKVLGGRFVNTFGLTIFKVLELRASTCAEVTLLAWAELSALIVLAGICAKTFGSSSFMSFAVRFLMSAGLACFGSSDSCLTATFDPALFDAVGVGDGCALLDTTGVGDG